MAKGQKVLVLANVQRKDRLADEIRDVIGSCFLGGRVADPRLQGVTITHVRLSGDLQQATVYFRFYGETKVEDVEKGLRSCKGFLRNALATNLRVRRVPELHFFYDKSVEYGSNIEDLLRKI